jgi:hypothetical protein
MTVKNGDRRTDTVRLFAYNDGQAIGGQELP